MKTLRSVAAVIGGYVLVVLITEFGFRLFPGGRAPKDGELAATVLATFIAVAAGFSGGCFAAMFAAWRPLVAASVVAAPLLVESVWLLTTRTPPADFWTDLTGVCMLIGSTLLGGYAGGRFTRRAARPGAGRSVTARE